MAAIFVSFVVMTEVSQRVVSQQTEWRAIMNAILFGWLWVLGRTTLLVALSALVVAGVLRLVRPKAPRVHRAAWCMVLLVGWLFAQMPVEVPWYGPAVSQNVAQPPPTVKRTPNDLQQPRAAGLQDAHDMQQPGTAVLQDAHDTQQPGAVVLHETTVELDQSTDEGTIELARGGIGGPLPTDLSNEPALVPVESSHAATISPTVPVDGPAAEIASPLADANRPSPARGILSRVSWQGILFSLWLAGMVVVVLRWLAGYVRSLRAMSTALRPDEASCRQWRELLAGQGVEREIPLRLTEG
ncbi:MAG TPA: hypothetical protein DD670_01375, partial [Planctomycetaceae bacterium]|nr:hypothetical protein [Planctomycetaceae bacterium]